MGKVWGVKNFSEKKFRGGVRNKEISGKIYLLRGGKRGGSPPRTRGKKKTEVELTDTFRGE